MTDVTEQEDMIFRYADYPTLYQSPSSLTAAYKSPCPDQRNHTKDGLSAIYVVSGGLKISYTKETSRHTGSKTRGSDVNA